MIIWNFSFEGYFIKNCFTRDVVAYALREESCGLYKLQGETLTIVETNSMIMTKPMKSHTFDIVN